MFDEWHDIKNYNSNNNNIDSRHEKWLKESRIENKKKTCQKITSRFFKKKKNK